MVTSAQIQPFVFRNLPKITREEIEFFQRWSKLIPADLIPPDFPTQLLSQLEPLIHGTVGWAWNNTGQMITLPQMQKICIPPTLLLQIAVLPIQQRLWVEFSPYLARTMLDRALGGSGENLEEGIPLSEMEKGIFTYLFLKILQGLQALWGNKTQVELRLEEIHPSLYAVAPQLDPHTTFYYKEMQLEFLGQFGFVRLFLPTQLVYEMTRSFSDLRHTPQEYAFFRKRIHRVASTPLQGFLKVGTVDLSETDFVGLQTDDIILIRDCMAYRREEDRLWAGEGVLQFSDQPHYALRCSLQNDASHHLMQVRIEEVIQVAEPAMNGRMDRSEYQMTNYPMNSNPSEYMDSPDAAGANFDQMGPVLSDVPVPLVAELGRIQCRARDIMYMQVGQILELNRSPHEPIDLVVQGQSIGRGELVEVDGKLGIRIISLNR